MRCVLGGPIQSACKIKPVKRAHLVVLQNPVPEFVDWAVDFWSTHHCDI